MVSKVVDKGTVPEREGTFDKHKLHARFDHTFLQHTAVPASTSRLGDTCRHSRQIPAPFDLPAGIARTRHLDVCLPERIDIPDAGRLFAQPLYRKILAESSWP